MAFVLLLSGCTQQPDMDPQAVLSRIEIKDQRTGDRITTCDVTCSGVTTWSRDVVAEKINPVLKWTEVDGVLVLRIPKWKFELDQLRDGSTNVWIYGVEGQ